MLILRHPAYSPWSGWLSRSEWNGSFSKRRIRSLSFCFSGFGSLFLFLSKRLEKLSLMHHFVQANVLHHLRCRTWAKIYLPCPHGCPATLHRGFFSFLRWGQAVLQIQCADS